MAIIRRRADDIITEEELNDSVNLTRIDAIHLQRQLIKSWEPKREVFALKYGTAIIGMACAASAAMINGFFRRKLKLRHSGQIFSTFTLMIGPGVLASISHDELITSKILLYSKECPICQEIKASAYLNGFAILYPLILSPTLNLAIAANLGLRTPYIYELKEIAKFWWSAVKPAYNYLSFLFCTNVVVANVVVYKQMKEAENIANTMIEVEKYMKNTET